MKHLFFFLFFFFPCFIKAFVHEVSQSSQLDVNVTLYQDMALIKEQRKAILKEGSNKLLIKDVPAVILMDSFLFQVTPSSSALKVLEYNFQASDITREVLLQHSVGKTVQILPSQLTQAPTPAKLLALDGDDVIVESLGLIFALKKNKIAFSHLPYSLVSEPLITLKLLNSKEGEYHFEMGYLAKGFSWDAGYTIIVDEEEKHLDLNNWISIRNESGVDIKKGYLQIAHAQQKEGQFYNIKQPTSLPDKATKIISWVEAKDLIPSKSFQIHPKNDIIHNEEGVVMKPTVETWLSVQNDISQGLGSPLPEGIIKVFRRNIDGSLFYISENKTPFTPVGKFFSLRVGSTKEVTAEMRQTDYRKLGSQVVESGYRLDLKNTTDVPKQVTVFQSVAGEWSILRETHPHEEEETRLKWTINLAAEEEVSLRYRIRMNVE